MPVRQQDIARHLGISIGTVSQALRNAPQVSKETCEAVLQAASELGYVYQPREVSNSRESLRSVLQNIAFISWSGPGVSFYMNVLQGAEQICREQDIEMQYAQLVSSTSAALQKFKKNDALILAGVFDEQTVHAFKDLGRPLVLVDNNLSHMGLDRVEIENFGSLYRSVHQLYAWGHRKIAFLRASNEEYPSFKNRLLGYRAAMDRLGLERQEIVCPERPLNIAGEEAIKNWLEQHQQLTFTALLCCNDGAAIGAINALHQQHLAVPDDVSVVGFDDTEIAELVRPTLTTCHVPLKLLGTLAVQRLIDRVLTPDAPTQAHVVDTTFVIRGSTRILTEQREHNA